MYTGKHSINTGSGSHCWLLLSVAITELIRSLQCPFLFASWWWSRVNLDASQNFDRRPSLDYNLARCTILQPTCRSRASSHRKPVLVSAGEIYETSVYCPCTNLYGSNYKPAGLVHHAVTRPAEGIWSSLILKWAAAKITPRSIWKCYRYVFGGGFETVSLFSDTFEEALDREPVWPSGKG